MRPARKGPENHSHSRAQGRASRPSMRPARKGPENHMLILGIWAIICDPSMRPARKGPENRVTLLSPTSEEVTFNEAGPQGAGKPTLEYRKLRAAQLPSMRPARKGPENHCAGRHRAGAPRRPSMRPARKGPENLVHRPADAVEHGRPSMRPARKGPENRCSTSRTTAATSAFNEAGPQGAGKPQGGGAWRGRGGPLQ